MITVCGTKNHRYIAAAAAVLSLATQDGTLVTTKSNRQFAQHAGDWKWWNKKTPKKLQELAEEGYKIVIFT